MDKKLTNTYTDKILFEGKKKVLDAKKPSGVVKKMPEDVISDGKAKKFVSKSGPEAVKGVEKPKKAHSEGLEWESRFARVFRTVINENDELQEPAPENEVNTDVDAGTDIDTDVDTDVDAGDGDVVSDLQDVVGKLQDILAALGGEVTEDDVVDGSDEFDAENTVNNEIDEIEPASNASEVKESLGDIKSALSGLKAKIGQLTGKANKVGGKLSKPSSGKADAGDELKPVAKSDLHSKNSYKVDSKLKTGSSLFEKRKK
jgi:hypothetical protein